MAMATELRREVAMRRFILMLSLAVVVSSAGFVLAIGQARVTPRAIALNTDWYNACTDASAPGNPYDATSWSSGQATWDYPSECDGCEDTSGLPSPHYTDVELDPDRVISCPNFGTTYVSSVYVYFCQSMTNAGQKIGTVQWRNSGGTLIATTDLELFGGGATTDVAYSVIRCSANKAEPYKLHIYWGGGALNPAAGNALEGFEIHIQCCNAK